MKKEIWKPIVGYEGLYEISSLGRVKRLSRISIDSLGRRTLFKEKILKNCISKQTGYPSVNLSKDGNVQTLNIHKLIADAFIPNPDNLPCINHIDENRANSVLSNLERCTYAYNNSYGNARIKRRNSLRRYFEEKNLKMNFLKKDVILSVTQYTLEGEIVNVFYGGYPEIRKITGFGTAVESCLCHKSNSAYGYVWRYFGDEFSYTKRRTNKGRKFSNVIHSHQKYVIQIDEDGKEIERYKSVSEAGEKNGFDRHYFSKIKPVDGVVTIKGKRFIVEKKENEYIPEGHKGTRPDLLGKGAKVVCQYTKDGEFIKKYASIREAAVSVGNPKSASDISNCCNGKLKSASGYIWAFEGERPYIFKNNTLRRVAQYTIGGELIREYNSIVDAIHTIGKGTSTCIGNNLAGRSHSAYGYVWKYAN